MKTKLLENQNFVIQPFSQKKNSVLQSELRSHIYNLVLFQEEKSG